MVYLGVDWSVKEVVCEAHGPSGTRPLRRSGVGPRLADVMALVSGVSRAFDDPEVAVFIEAGAPQWLRLFHATGAQVFVVDSKQAHRFGESLSSAGAKDDRRDARSLALMGQSEAHRGKAWVPGSIEEQRLDRLARSHEQLTRHETRVVQQLRALLREEMPLIEPLFKNVRARWAQKLLEAAPTLWHLRQLSREEFDQLLSGTRSHHKRRTALWQAIQDSEAPWLSVEVAEINAVVIRGQVALLSQLVRQRKELFRLMERELASFEPAAQLLSIKGIGPLLASAVLIHGFLGLGAVKDRDSVSVQMGASPVFRGSGKTRRGRPKGRTVMRRAAASHARKSSYLLGMMVSVHTDWGRAMYKDGRSRGQSAATAYRRLARSMLRIVTALIRSGEDYDEARYIRALQAKGVPWAMGLGEQSAQLAAK